MTRPFNGAKYKALLEGLEATEVSRCDLLVDNNPFRLDSEYNLGEHRRQADAVRQFGAEQLGDSTPTIIHPHEIVRNYVEEGGIWFFRAQNLRPLQIDESNKVFVSLGDASRLVKNTLTHGDILMTRTGANRGDCALFDSTESAVASSHTFIIRSQRWIPAFLVAFFNSRYGKAQIDRGVYGAAQPEISPYFLRKIWVPRVTEEFQKTIANLFSSAGSSRCESLGLLCDTEKTLLRALGLQDWQPPEPLTYTRRASEVFAAGRMDADLFQPRYDALRTELEKTAKLRRLDSFGEVAPADFVPIQSQTYRYTEIGDVNVSNGAVGWNLVRGEELPANAKIRLSGGELLVSKVRPTRGAIGINYESASSDHVCSGAFLVIRTASPCREFLQVFLRSLAGKLLLEEHCKGSSYPTLDDDDIRAVLVPEVSDRLMATIKDRVGAAHVARRRAYALLERAKRSVEIAIEETEAAALRFLAEPLEV